MEGESPTLNYNYSFRMLQQKFQAFGFYEWQTLVTWVENIELWWIMLKYKKPRWNSTLRVDKWLIDFDWLISTDSLVPTDLMILTCWPYSIRRKTSFENQFNKGSNFADFVRFRPHTYARTQLRYDWKLPKQVIRKVNQHKLIYSLSLSLSIDFRLTHNSFIPPRKIK